MTDRKPVIVSFKSSSLSPFQSMIEETDAAAARVWLHVFDCRCLCETTIQAQSPRHYHARLAREAIETIGPETNVVIVGKNTRQAFSKNLSKPIGSMVIHPYIVDQRVWRVLPPPGSIDYENPIFRRMVGMLLASLTRE